MAHASSPQTCSKGFDPFDAKKIKRHRARDDSEKFVTG